MKKIFLIVPILLFLSTSCKAQNNFINYNQATINGHSVFKTTSEYLIEQFGQPNSTENYFYEMENSEGEIYHYLGVSFYINNNMVNGFEIDSNQFNFTANNIKVGNNIDSIQQIYPDSYENRTQDEIIISFSNADYFILIKYDLNDLIQKISLEVY